jgi:hypothetical protein
LWWTKRHWGRFSPSTLVSPANHSTDFSIIIITRGWGNRPLSGRSVEWALIPPPTMQIKKKLVIIFETQPTVNSHHWDASHRLRNTSLKDRSRIRSFPFCDHWYLLQIWCLHEDVTTLRSKYQHSKSSNWNGLCRSKMSQILFMVDCV